MHMHSVLLLVSSTILISCGSVPTQPYSKAPPAPDGFGTIYIYRAAAYPPTRKPDVSISDVKVFEPSDKTYTWVHVKQGERRILVEWAFDLGYTPGTIKLSVSAGESYYIKVAGSWRPGFGGTTVMSAWAETVPTSEAEGELSRCCRFIKPEKALIQ